MMTFRAACCSLRASPVLDMATLHKQDAGVARVYDLHVERLVATSPCFCTCSTSVSVLHVEGIGPLLRSDEWERIRDGMRLRLLT